MSEKLSVPDGFTLLRAEDYSALQDLAGHARAWAEAERRLVAHDRATPNGYDYPRGGWSAAYNRWLDARHPLREAERQAIIALHAAARASLPPEAPRHG